MITRKNITQQRCLPVQLGKVQPSSLQSSQSGFTIVESLMAIVVVAILMVAIAPVLTLSVATRVQSRRVEVATQAARAYIDGVRSGAITPPPSTTGELKVFPPPTSSGSLNCTANSYCPSPLQNLYCVVLFGNQCNANSRTDMLVQAFRRNPDSADPNKGYRLGLRVYRADAFKETGLLNDEKKQATFTGGLGDRKEPMVEMTTEIIVTNKTKYQDLCDRLKDPDNPSGCEE